MASLAAMAWTPTLAHGVFDIMRRPCAAGSARGFTLVEMMVVLLIVGIVTAVTSLAVDAVRHRDSRYAGERLRRVLEASAMRAETRGQALAIDLLADGYRFRSLQADGRWRPLEDPPVFVEYILPPGFAWGHLANERQVTDATGQRLVFGARSPEFELTLISPQGVLRYRGSPSGAVSLALLRTEAP